MKSGLEDRNNLVDSLLEGQHLCIGLNEVRPGRPEQYLTAFPLFQSLRGLNEVRPGRPEQ